MCFCVGGRLHLGGEPGNDRFRNRFGSLFILLKHSPYRRFQVNDFDPRAIIGEEVDPALPRQTRRVRRVEGEIAARAQMFATMLARKCSRQCSRAVWITVP